MAALTQDRNTAARSGQQLALPVAAATVIYMGSMVAVDAAGNAVPASDTAGLKVVGRAMQQVDNSAGLAGDLTVQVDRLAAFKFANSATVPVTAANLFQPVMVADDQTVAATSTNSIAAGVAVQIDPDGVWVEIK